MNCFSWRLRRTAPAHGSSKNELVSSRPPRINGWSCPPQPLQVIGWLVYSFLAIVGFGIHIPLLPRPWSHVVYALMGIVFIVHFFTHIAAVTVDPADAGVRAKKSYSTPLPLFDRTKRSHVIQDLHCYLCDVKVGPKTKHCSVCNKCVEDFDHHCKWLNTCVGSRNYRFFFLALVSATLGVTLIIVVSLFIFIQHYLDPHSLRTAPQFHKAMLGNTTWLLFLPLAPIKTSSAGLLVLAFVTIVLSTICLLLLGHLLGFHLYLFYKGISTYNYVKMKRQKESANRDTKTVNPCDAKTKRNTQESQVRSIDCEPGLSESSSSCKFDEGPLSRDFSESICIELQNFKKSSEKENSFHYGTERPTEMSTREMSMNVVKKWKPDDEDAQSASVDSLPVAQDPLGSSVMASDNT